MKEFLLRHKTKKKKDGEMSKLLLLTMLSLIAATAAQWNDINYPNSGQFPNFPTIDCNAPGANCQTETKEMVCDAHGNCKEKTMKSGSNAVATVNAALLISCGAIVAIKMYR